MVHTFPDYLNLDHDDGREAAVADYPTLADKLEKIAAVAATALE